jgi:hypothetical protein
MPTDDVRQLRCWCQAMEQSPAAVVMPGSSNTSSIGLDVRSFLPATYLNDFFIQLKK